MSARVKAGWLIVGSLCTSACGSEVSPETSAFPEAALATLSSDEGKLVIEVRTAPDQPPGRGVDGVELFVKSAEGVPLEGLAITSLPWMPSMGHGTSVLPTITERGQGRYVLGNVYLYMPGRWELRTSFSGSVTDGAAPAFEVP